jgi:calcium-translocating P-type ATPase
MARPLALSPFLTGDPIRLGPECASLSDLLRPLGLDSLEAPGFLSLAPRVALVHSLTGGEGSVTLRWVHLPHAPTLGAGAGPVEIAVVLTAPIRESGRAVRVVSRLMAVLRDPALLEQAGTQTTREGLVRILAAAEETPGESPLSGPDLLLLLGSGPAGLAAGEATRRRRACGPNRIERVRRRPLAARFLEQFVSLFALLLWVGGGFAFLAGMPELGWAIFVVIVVNGVFSFFQEYRAERAVEALQELLPHEITVLRDGGEVRLPAVELVPGDLVRLEEGDQVPADGQLLSAEGLRVDQSPLTGESHPVFKLPTVTNARERVPPEERHELVFAGTGVVSGTGTFVVHATGMATEIGSIAHLTQSVVEEPSPLQREMVRVTRIVTLLAVSFGVGFFVLGVATGVMPLSEGFIFALGVIVANVPEGLLPTLTLALALGVQRMARQRSLMKRLSAVETLGATTVICTDKTGTLTQNRMAARFIWISGRTLEVSALNGDAAGEIRDLFEAGVLASQATLEHGDPTEVALVSAAVGAGVEPEKVRRDHDLLAPYPFDSFRKRMTLVRATGGGATGYVKGAPKETLALCAAVRWNGQTLPLTDELRRSILADHDRLAGEGLRILAVAVRVIPDGLIRAPASAVERELTFLGLVALWDPPRPEVSEAVSLCRRAGIRVIMVTGDYGLTARTIARQIGLSVEKVVTGEELERLSPEALRGLLKEAGVLFARTSPAHKLAIVSGLKALGEVVAVTGDGVNDAPALKAADIGVAMGKRGSEVAKEAAEMVITDDNFASIVTAIRHGRATYANMGKFITYIFASNVPELVPFLAFVFFRIPLPLTVMQILAVDLGTDLLPALALGAEPPEPGVMDRPPRPRSQRLLGAGRLLRAYAFLGVVEAALSLLAFFWTYWMSGWRPGLPMAATGDLYRRATTMTLSGIVATQVGNVFACRTDRESVFRVGLLSNRLVFPGIVAEVGILAGLILIPSMAYVFGLARLGFSEWGLLLLFPPAVLVLEEARKWLVRRGAGASSIYVAQVSGR